MKKYLLLSLIFLFSVIPFFVVNASDYFVDDFNSYDLDPINGQGDWISSSSDFIITDEGCVDDKCLKVNNQYITTNLYNVPDGQLTGRVSFNIYVPSSNLCDWQITLEPNIQIGPIDTGNCTDITINNYYATEKVKEDYLHDQWFSLIIEWDQPNNHIRAKYNNDAWTDYLTYPGTTPTTRFELYKFNETYLLNGIMIDNISAEDVEYSCFDLFDDMTSCTAGGCYWGFDPDMTCDAYGCYLGGSGSSYCSSEPFGTCDQNCSACSDETACGTNIFCYWTGDRCVDKSLSGECGAGILCNNCSDQETCETNSCFWSEGDNACFISGSDAQSTALGGVSDWFTRVFAVWNKAPFNYVLSFISAIGDISPTENAITTIDLNLGDLAGDGSGDLTVSALDFETLFNKTVQFGSHYYLISDVLLLMSRIFIIINAFFGFWAWASWIFGFGSTSEIGFKG